MRDVCRKSKARLILHFPLQKEKVAITTMSYVLIKKWSVGMPVRIFHRSGWPAGTRISFIGWSSNLIYWRNRVKVAKFRLLGNRMCGNWQMLLSRLGGITGHGVIMWMWKPGRLLLTIRQEGQWPLEAWLWLRSIIGSPLIFRSPARRPKFIMTVLLWLVLLPEVVEIFCKTRIRRQPLRLWPLWWRYMKWQERSFIWNSLPTWRTYAQLGRFLFLTVCLKKPH